MSENYPVNREDLQKNGVRGIVSAVAGVGCIVVNSLLSVPVLGAVLGGALVVAGVVGLVGKKRTDKVTSTVLLVAGGLGVASLFLKGPVGFVLGVGGLGLIGYGVYNFVKFIKGLRNR